MMCYRDRTWCDDYKRCEKGKTCDRAFTPKVREAADKWWNGGDLSKGTAPVCFFFGEPECMVCPAITPAEVV